MKGWSDSDIGIAIASKGVPEPGGVVPPAVTGIPEEKAETMAAAPSCFPETGFRDRAARILIVEDDPDSRRLLGTLMGRLGYDCRLATDGQRALDLVADEAPDLILMDLMMPVLDGIEATRRLKADDRTRAIPVVALTGNATPDGQQAARGAGVDAFLTKPVVFQELVARVKAILGEC